LTTALFLLDTALDAVILLIAARFENRWIRPRRLLLGAVLGAGCAWLARVLALSQGLAAMLWLPTACLMTLAAQGKRAILHPVRCICLLLCAAGLLGGTLTALCGAMGSLGIAYAAGCVCMAVMTVNLLRTRRAAMDVKRVQITCSHRGRTVQFEAMIDSGNTLRDYLTHYPVIVMPKHVGNRLFGFKDEMLRPIFADTAGGRQMMDLFVPQEMFVIADRQKRKVHAALALCSGLSDDTPALVPVSLIDDE